MKTVSKVDLSVYLPEIEKTLKTLLARFEKNPLLYNGARHSLLNPGKRIRPLLTLATVASLGGALEEAILPASALEILHTYSLIHDDLPCMDDDDLRRGKPTLHKIYNEGQAVLIGDLLLTLAFETLSESKDLPPEKTLRLIQILAKKSGGEGMILGQSLDLAYEGKTLSLECLKEVHKRKTGDLISACLEFGGVITGSPKKTCETLALIGEEVGLSFQIIDDTLDIEGEASLIGKPLHSDEVNAKSTSVTLLGLDEAKAYAKTLLDSALNRCKDIGIEDSPLAELLPKLVFRLF